jgi:hypothetical protein
VNGNVMQRRNRLSYAILHQVSGEYRGKFGGLTVNAGVRVPFFKRNLNQYCFTNRTVVTPASHGCDANAAFAAANPYVDDPTTGLPVTGYAAPQQRMFTYAPAAERGRDACGVECGQHLRQLFEGLAGAGHGQPLQLVLLPGGQCLGQAQPGIDRQLRPGRALSFGQAHGPGFDLVHDLPEPPGFDLRS